MSIQRVGEAMIASGRPPADAEPTDRPVDEAGAEALLASRREFRARLRVLVDSRGGVSEVARRSGIPEPYLRRFLSSLAEPAAATLRRLAEAIGPGMPADPG